MNVLRMITTKYFIDVFEIKTRQTKINSLKYHTLCTTASPKLRADGAVNEVRDILLMLETTNPGRTLITSMR